MVSSFPSDGFVRSADGVPGVLGVQTQAVGGAVEHPGLDGLVDGYRRLMLYTILIVLAIIALLVFIFGRRRV